MERTPTECGQLDAIRGRIRRLREYLDAHPEPDVDATAGEWFAFLADMKAILGNPNNDLSFVATLMAKDYLCRTLPMRPFDAAEKAMGAPGLDIDERTVDGNRVVAEIKTTTLFLGDELGAMQKATFLKDFAELQQAEADYKFFFVTDGRTFAVVKSRYARGLTGITVVRLGDEKAPSS